MRDKTRSRWRRGRTAFCRAADIDSQRWALDGARCVLLQLEVPMEAVAEGLREARRVGAIGILDPAPARALPKEILELVDIATPNENEACVLAGVPPSRVSAADAVALGNKIRDLGVRSVIVKLGDQGCVYCGADGTFAAPPFPVRAVDSTAAGDTFNAALAVALVEGAAMEDALRFANAAAAISVTRAGAQTSAPARAEVESLFARDAFHPLLTNPAAPGLQRELERYKSDCRPNVAVAQPHSRPKDRRTDLLRIRRHIDARSGLFWSCRDTGLTHHHRSLLDNFRGLARSQALFV